MAEIPLPESENGDIYSLGFDRNLNRDFGAEREQKNALLYNSIEDSTNASLVSGGVLSGVPISTIPNNTATDISVLEYSHNIVFSVTDADTAEWAAGTITMSNGRAFSIVAGNTGNMTAATFIYVDTALSSTVLQTTTAAATAAGANKILIAIAQNGTGAATFQVFGGVGGVTVGSASLPISSRGWTYSGAFASDSNVQVSWATGTFTPSSGTAYSITGANTGTMAAVTYIFLDIAVSTTAFQTTTTAASAVGNGRVLIAVAQNVATGRNAIYQVFGGNATGSHAKLITATDIAATTITADEIAANTITAGKMSVSQLSAIAADLGSITAGSVSVVNGLNTIGLTPSGTNAIFSGTTGSPQFKVTPAGAVTASNITITGGSIDGVPISGIPNNATTDISLLEANSDLVFSVTDADTIAWAAGTINLSNGRTFAISAGNTGNMVALTYIYLSPLPNAGGSDTVLQTTTTYSTAIGANKKLVGVAQNQTVTASFIPMGIGGKVLVDGEQIGALSIVAGNIAATTITAAKMNVTQLSAIAADLGTITAGTVTGATIRTAASGDRFSMTSTAFQGIEAGGNVIYEILLTGVNAGDVIMGDDASGNYAIWDDSATSFNVYKNNVTITKFGGDGSNGALALTAGATDLDVLAAAYYARNYTSVSITSTGSLTFSNPHANGTHHHIRSQGNVTLTSTTAPMIDCAAQGAASATAAITTASVTAKTGTVGSNNSGNSGGAGGAGGAGNSSIDEMFEVALKAGQSVLLASGAGGAVGGSGGGGGGGAGGRGGGALYIECSGAWNFTTASGISVAGAVGSNGGGGGAAGGGGGGGGGSAGTCIVLYGTNTANTGTITITGGAGGNGGSTLDDASTPAGGAGGTGVAGDSNGGTGGTGASCTAGCGGTSGGGGGAGGAASLNGGGNGAAGTAGTNGAGARSGGGGAGGAAGYSAVAANIWFT